MNGELEKGKGEASGSGTAYRFSYQVIYVLKEGACCEHGTHDELMNMTPGENYPELLKL